nr:RNA-directed DNA polymerase, eukaryota, reverse transcriptase zinc-binding domain protein [Tanacetum cinerariifolium]
TEGLHAFICKAENIGIYNGASIGCEAGKLPMKYLGVLVGCNMVRRNNWEALKNRFPRIYMLDNDKGFSVANRLPMLDWSSFLRRIPRGGVEDAQFFELHLIIDPIVLTSQKDYWLWSLDVSKGFTVASVRSLIDAHTLGCGPIATR